MEGIGTEESGGCIQFTFPLSRKGGQTVIEAENISKRYDTVPVFDHFSLKIEKGDRIGVVGLNGAGKSTLARLLAGREPIDAGQITPGYQIDIGYFAQDQSEELNPALTVYEAASASPVRATETQIRSILGAFLFSADDIGKSVSVLSGGEKNRLALARLLLCPANFLILDEPTNHLDMTSKAVLQEAILTFPGTTFVVSHDRDFLNPVVNKILEIQPGAVRSFPGNLNDYLWKVDQEKRNDETDTKSKTQSITENPKERRRRQAQLQATKAPLKKALSALEKEIEGLEEQIATREAAMADKSFFEKGEETATLMREYETWKTQLTDTMERWEETANKLSALE